MNVVWIKGPDEKYWAAGLQWRAAEDIKEAKTLARDEAVALAEKRSSGGDDSCVAGHVVLGNKGSNSCVFGIGCISQGTLKEKGFKKHYVAASLAAAAASSLEDGIYLFPVLGLEDKQLFWLLGVSGNMVIPQTDLVFEDPQEAASNCAMLRALMSNLTIHVDPQSGLAVSMDQEEFSWSDIKFEQKIARLAFSSAKSQPSKLAAVIKGAVTVLVLAGLGGGGWYYYESTKPKPLTPEEIARQRRQAYESEVSAIAQQYAPALLQWRWEQAKRIDMLARTSHGSGLVPVLLDCTENSCSLTMALAEDFLPLTKALETRFKKHGYEVTVSSDAGNRWNFNLAFQPPDNVLAEVSSDAIRKNLLKDDLYVKLIGELSSALGKEISPHIKTLDSSAGIVAQTSTTMDGEPRIEVASAGVEFYTPAGTRFVEEFAKASMSRIGPVKIKYGESGEVASIEAKMHWLAGK